MRLLLLFIVFIIQTLSLNAQTTLLNIRVDSISTRTHTVEQNQAIILSEIQNLESEFQEVNKINDSLRVELAHYQAKEDYFATALGTQATRFSTMLGIIVGLAGLFSFGVFKYEMISQKNQFTKLINNQNELFNKELIRSREMEKKLSITMANLNVTIAKTAYPKSKSIALLFYLKSVNNFIQHERIKNDLDNDKSPNYTVALTNIQSAKNILKLYEENNYSDDYKTAFLNNYSNYIETIGSMEFTGSDDMNFAVSEIKVELKKVQDKFKN
ncbi:hypothetical protein [Leeuwenhoekiella sp. ZYFB001]|uniref:hypothetical protein n=1 Tax=Leeuwenhoekiella sp. ZYFB001 TaxID=2719912 RepID=UPI00142FDBD6|nr:hypothetical protein [Leeuwenhoekiella sp. ZYFB001]